MIRPVYGGPHGCGWSAQCEVPRLRWRFPDVRRLSASRLSIYHLASRSLHSWYRPLDGSKSSADESRQDRVALGWLQIQHHDVGQFCSCPAARLRQCDRQRSCTSTRSDYFVGSDPREARFEDLRSWLLPASPTSSHPAIARRWIGSNSRACFREVARWRLLVRRSGTHCQMNSEIRRVMSTASNSFLKQSCSAFTSVTSALEVNFNVMRYINSRFTYLLTYLLTYPKHTGFSEFFAISDCEWNWMLDCLAAQHTRLRSFFTGRGCYKHGSRDRRDKLHIKNINIHAATSIRHTTRDHS